MDYKTFKKWRAYKNKTRLYLWLKNDFWNWNVHGTKFWLFYADQVVRLNFHFVTIEREKKHCKNLFTCTQTVAVSTSSRGRDCGATLRSTPVSFSVIYLLLRLSLKTYINTTNQLSFFTLTQPNRNVSISHWKHPNSFFSHLVAILFLFSTASFFSPPRVQLGVSKLSLRLLLFSSFSFFLLPFF